MPYCTYLTGSRGEDLWYLSAASGIWVRWVSGLAAHGFSTDLPQRGCLVAHGAAGMRVWDDFAGYRAIRILSWCICRHFMSWVGILGRAMENGLIFYLCTVKRFFVLFGGLRGKS